MKQELVGQNITPIYNFTCEGCNTTSSDYDRTQGTCIKCGKEICDNCSEDVSLLESLGEEVDLYYSEIPVETIDLEICASCAKEHKITQKNYNKLLSKAIKKFNKEVKALNSTFIGEK